MLFVRQALTSTFRCILVQFSLIRPYKMSKAGRRGASFHLIACIICFHNKGVVCLVSIPPKMFIRRWCPASLLLGLVRRRVSRER
jgi:hypothetical protein